MTRRLDKVVDSITTELEKFPQLKTANDGWKAYKNTFHDGQLAQFLAKRASGVEKASPEKFFNTFVRGTSKSANAQQVKRVFDNYDTSGKMREAFVSGIKENFDASLNLLMEGKGGLKASQWSTWIRQNREAMKAFDKQLGTDLMSRYGNFRKAALAADEATASMKELEGLSFTQKMGGELDKTVATHLTSGNLKGLVEKMPTPFLKRAVTKRAAANLIDMDKNIASPDKLYAATQSNKEALIEGLGVDSYKRVESVSNAIKQQAASYSGAPIPAIRTQLLTEGEAVKRTRSEERRVGKECRYRWSPYH